MKNKNKYYDEDIVNGFASDKAWGRAWASAIAEAWENEEFKKDLLSKDQEIIRNLFEGLGYTIPQGMKVYIEELDKETVKGKKYKKARIAINEKDGDEYKENQSQFLPVNGWYQLKDELSPIVTMILPPTPKKDQASALADYESLGKSYPFTTT